jgi:DNA repair photolyase
MKINKVQCKSILNKSKLPETDYCINPYTGCSHKCVYCYARFMKRFSKNTGEWGSFVDVKENAREVLYRQLRSLKLKGNERILIGSVTDAYQPIELKYQLTRKILQTLLPYKFYISILTKSYNVTRDIDILSRLSSCEVGLSINTLDEEFGKIIEPGASPIDKRIDALKMLKENGVKTYVFIGPIFPGFGNTGDVIERIGEYADLIMAEALNCKCGNWLDIVEAINRFKPEKLEEFKKNIKDMNTWVEEERIFIDKCNEMNVRVGGFFYH